jgi:hypothetical protein
VGILGGTFYLFVRFGARLLCSHYAAIRLG